MNEEIKIGDTVVIPKGTSVAQWDTMLVTKRDKKVKVFRIFSLDENIVTVISHGQWESGTMIAQFFSKSVLNAVRVQDVRKL